MIFLKTLIVVKDGKFPKWLMEKFEEVLQANEGKRLTVSVETEKRYRSRPENSFYYGVVLPLLYSVMRDDWGNDVTKGDVHDYLKGPVGKLYKDIQDGNGEIHQVLRSSADLSVTEFENWMQAIRAWAAPLGVQVPLPNELMYMGQEEM